MRYLALVIGLVGAVVCLAGLYMWAISGGKCETNCEGYLWLLYLALPGAGVAAAGLGLNRFLRKRPGNGRH